MGGLTAGRGRDMTSLHTFLHTQYGYMLGGLCLSPSLLLSVESQAKCMWLCDVACILLQSSRAVNAAD